MKNNNKEAYSIILSLLLIGFLLVITAGVFNLVLKELNDNRGMGNYMKAYAGAESAQELALLKIKEKGYGFYEKIENTSSSGKILVSDPLNYKAAKDVIISYDIGSKADSYTGTINKLGYDIIPLFYTGITSNKTENINLSINFGDGSDLVWNIISSISSISGTGSFNGSSDYGIVGFEGNKNINNFLTNNSNNYLMLFNSGNSNEIKYTLTSTDGSFTKPETTIVSSGQVGKYRQNLRTDLDNTKYLNFLKYSIYSN